MSSDVDEITESSTSREPSTRSSTSSETRCLNPRSNASFEHSVARLAPSAEVNDFGADARVPVRPRAHSRRTVREGTGPLEILFVGLGDTARGQMAAALTAARSSEGRINAHSAGSNTASSTIDPNVVAATAQLDVDLGEAFAKPLSDEVLRAAEHRRDDGAKRRECRDPGTDTAVFDWRVGDPTGADVVGSACRS